MITAFEGWSSTCYGVTCQAGECSGSLTLEQGKQVLDDDANGFEDCVRSAVKVPITQNQFDSLVSFSYNVGCAGLQSSTLLSELNAGTLTDAEAQYQFTRWHSGCLAGLERRRFTESLLFSTCDDDFKCTSSDCSISYNYPSCSSNCQYCTACGGCSGNAYTLPECVNP